MSLISLHYLASFAKDNTISNNYKITFENRTQKTLLDGQLYTSFKETGYKESDFLNYVETQPKSDQLETTNVISAYLTYAKELYYKKNSEQQTDFYREVKAQESRQTWENLGAIFAAGALEKMGQKSDGYKVIAETAKKASEQREQERNRVFTNETEPHDTFSKRISLKSSFERFSKKYLENIFEKLGVNDFIRNAEHSETERQILEKAEPAIKKTKDSIEAAFSILDGKLKEFSYPENLMELSGLVKINQGKGFFDINKLTELKFRSKPEQQGEAMKYFISQLEIYNKQNPGNENKIPKPVFSALAKESRDKYLTAKLLFPDYDQQALVDAKDIKERTLTRSRDETVTSARSQFYSGIMTSFIPEKDLQEKVAVLR